MRSPRRAAIAVVFAMLFAASVVIPAPAHASADEEAEMLSLVNDLRARRGLASVTVQGELRALANEWAGRMASSLAIFHSPLNTRVTSRWITLGENVAIDLSVAAAERALEASPGHLANLVNPAFNYIGIGVARGSDGGLYVVQEFIQAGAAPVATPAPRRPAAARAPAVRARPSPPPEPAPPPPPPPPPEPSRRLADMFGRLRDLDEAVESSDYGLVRMNE